MAAPYSDLLQKTEAALQDAVDGLTSLTGVVFLTGSDDATKSSPNVICVAESSEPEEPLDMGLYRVNARVTVNSQASEDTGLTIHRTRVATVFDAVLDDAIAATLSASQTDYYVYDVDFQGYQKDNTSTEFSDSVLLDVLCCASDIS